MTNPETQALLLPLLQLAADNQPHSTAAAVQTLADSLGLSAQDRDERAASGKRIFNDRLSRARRYLVEAGLLQTVGRGQFKITPAGQALLNQQPKTLDLAAIRAFNAARQDIAKEQEPMEDSQHHETMEEEVPQDDEPLRLPHEDTFDAFVRHQKNAIEELDRALYALIPPGFKEHGEASLRAFGEGVQVMLDGADDVLNEVADMILGPFKPYVDSPNAAPVEEPMEEE